MRLTRRARTLLTLLVLVLLAGPALVACGEADEAEPAAAEASGPSYEPREFAERMARPGTLLIDVRTPEEFAAGHIEGARNLPLSAPDFAERVERLDPSATYAVYCRTDSRSGDALEVMAAHGVRHTFDLEGGMDAWQDYGGAVVTH